MKRLNKLEINSEKIIKNEELTTLKGGYDISCCVCYFGWPIEPVSNMISTKEACDDDCKDAGYFYGIWYCL